MVVVAVVVELETFEAFFSFLFFFIPRTLFLFPKFVFPRAYENGLSINDKSVSAAGNPNTEHRTVEHVNP